MIYADYFYFVVLTRSLWCSSCRNCSCPCWLPEVEQKSQSAALCRKVTVKWSRVYTQKYPVRDWNTKQFFLGRELENYPFWFSSKSPFRLLIYTHKKSKKSNKSDWIYLKWSPTVLYSSDFSQRVDGCLYILLLSHCVNVFLTKDGLTCKELITIKHIEFYDYFRSNLYI